MLLPDNDHADDTPLSADELIDAAISARRHSPNLNYLAFTATPKAKTLELFGRRPKPDEPPSKQVLPEAFQPYYETAELKCVSDPDLIF